jgi:hypothetical protein
MLAYSEAEMTTLSSNSDSIFSISTHKFIEEKVYRDNMWIFSNVITHQLKNKICMKAQTILEH